MNKPPAPEPQLSVEGLVVSYGETVAVRDVSMRVDPGEIVGLIGPNGAGKSSVLMAIAGLVSARGSVTFEGEQMLGQPAETVVARGIALVPEGRRILATLSVEENLMLGATVRRDGDVAADMAAFGRRFPILEQRRASPAGTLSGGEQQQLALARALMSKPRLVLLDEPSLGLAPNLVDMVYRIIDELKEQGTSMLIVEQFATRITRFAHRTYVMRSGEVAFSGDRDEMSQLDQAVYRDAYLGGGQQTR